MLNENPATALVKASQSPALARVSNQLALTEKLLTKPEEPFLIPYRKGDKWGFCDRNKNIMIDCVYDRTYASSEGLACVVLGGKMGFVNIKGHVVIDMHYDAPKYRYNGQILKFSAMPFNRFNHNGYFFTEKLACVIENDKFGYINKLGQIVIPPKYDDANYFQDGLASVRLNGKWGFIDKSGQEVIPFIYTGADFFSEGLAAVEKYDWGILPYGFINKENRPIIDFRYKAIQPYSEGVALVLNAFEDYQYIDKSGTLAINAEFTDAKSFSEGLAPMQKSAFGQYGYVNKLGQERIPFIYESVDIFSEGLAGVESDGKFGYINNLNENVIPFKYEYAEPFHKGYAVVVNKGNQGYIDKNGIEYWED